MFIEVNPQICDGCGVCELVCSARGRNSFNPKKSRIKIIKNYFDFNSAVVCYQCENHLCVDSCKFDAFVEFDDNIFKIDVEKCNLCTECVKACPYHAVWIFADEILKCDLCEGEPLCEKYCPRNAITVRR